MDITVGSWGRTSSVGLSWAVMESLKAWQFSVPKDTLAIPFAVALSLSAFHILYAAAKYFFLSRQTFQQPAVPPPNREDLASFSEVLQTRVKEHGGWAIYTYAIGRLVGCTILLGLSLITLHDSLDSGNRNTSQFLQLLELLECPEMFMTITYVYSCGCALAAVAMTKQPRTLANCNAFVLLAAFCVYLYRDIWPLATYTEVPQDLHEGRLLWAKIVVLLITAVLIPLFVPNLYVPVDPKNPMPIPNPEQTCSLFSFITFTYIDPIIRLSHKMDHLDAKKLPPLCDTDASRNLVKNAFPHMDPFQKTGSRHIAFGLLRALRTEYLMMAFVVVMVCVTDFIPPVSIYFILSYIENGGAGNIVRPWFWVFCLFLGPLLCTGFWQSYIFYGTRALAHAEAILTQIIFEHSLRIRFTAEAVTDHTTVKQAEHDGSTVVATPDTASEVEDGTPESSSDSRSTLTKASATAKAKSNISVGAPVPTVTPAASPLEPKSVKKQSNLVGKINNFVTTDLENITDAKDFLLFVINMPLQIIISVLFLYKLLGWSSFVGLACMILLLPAPGYATKLIQVFQKRKMEKTDARIQIVTEVINVLRMVKLFGWERKMLNRIQDMREQELTSIWWLKVLRSIIGIINSIIPTITMLATYITYTVVMKKELTASVIFSSLTVFGVMRNHLFGISWQISTIIQAKVSLDRINDFLKETELLDSFIESKENTSASLGEPTTFDQNIIGFKNASFVWSLDSADGRSTPSGRSYNLRVTGELFFKPNCINLIVGPTGSGKTSMLMALLGEMHFIRNDLDSWFNLPRDGGVAYAAQESWVQNETIRSNILFGSPYDEVRYKKVLAQCALDKDLELFDVGDETEVGEKGITLSGGQKVARLTLARAIYSSAKIILLDDVLAALDVHTSTKIVKKCFQGDLVKGRTLILVTHNIALMSPIASYIVSIGQDGSITSRGNDINVALKSNPLLVGKEADNDAEELETGSQDVTVPFRNESPANGGKLVLTEEIANGHVSWKSLKLFFTAVGGRRPYIFFSAWLSGFLLKHAIDAFQKWFLGYWGSQYETHNPSEVSVSYYCALYSGIIVLAIAMDNISYIIYITGTIRASRTINTLLVESVLGSTLRWLDETPTARIITRFTQDMQMIDGSLPQEFFGLTFLFLSLITSISVVLIFTPVFVIPTLVIAALGFYLGSLYLKAQLSTTREKSNARSPVLAHFSAAIAGVVSIRAYGAQKHFKSESLNRIDNFMRINRITYNLNRWIGVRIDVLGGIFSAALATYLIYGKSIGASNTGFSLNMTTELCTTLLYLVRFFNDFEVQSNSLERVQAYLDIDHEPKFVESGIPAAAWPTSGDLIVENLSARYSENGPKVLHNITFRIKSGERIGIVGRTGSGKSSLTLALLRCIITEGSIYYDGIDTSTINLDALRSNITIIPQTPELISGTLRRNLDPFDQHDDVVLNDALRAAGLFELQEELQEARLTLDSNIALAGSNLSVGEKQILALARAMIRGSKLLVLDEATSAIDHKTDFAIQTTLRHKLDPGVTVITVAHRLQTVMDADRIMVMDEGCIAEFDTPQSLLKRERGLFKALVEGSANKDVLYEVAGLTASGSSK